MTTTLKRVGRKAVVVDLMLKAADALAGPPYQGISTHVAAIGTIACDYADLADRYEDTLREVLVNMGFKDAAIDRAIAEVEAGKPRARVAVDGSVGGPADGSGEGGTS